MSVFEFAGHTLDLKHGRLRNRSGDVTLRAKSLALLVYLVKNPGRVIDKNELIGAVWPDVIVSDGSLSQCLKDIRSALGSEAEGFIRTVPRRGYILDEERLRSYGEDRDHQRRQEPRSPTDKPSIAVLPFSNMSGDPEQEFFTDGITEDIITDLSKASGLSVIARNSVFTYKGRAVDVVEVGARFNVSSVLEGSVRKSGQRVRINEQLVNVLDGTHVWAERYDRDLSDIFAVQDEIAHSIVDALKVRLLPRESQAIRKIRTKSSEAYQFYLRGRHYLGQHSLRAYDSAHRMFMKAIELDTDYAQAYAGAADCNAFRCMFNADVSVDHILALSAKALDLDPELAEAHASRGFALSVAGKYEEASQEFEQAIRLDPNSFEAHYFYARSYALQGRHAEAARCFEQTTEIAPDDFQAFGNLSHQYEALGRRDDAILAERRCLERAERELDLRPDNLRAVCYGALSLTVLGEVERARQWAERALWLEPNDAQILYNIASVYSLLGDGDRAIELLQRGLHPRLATWARHDVDFAPLRDDPRFLALLGACPDRRCGGHLLQV
jgi:adenylate cyclase